MLISVLIPVYNEEGNLHPLYEKLVRVFESDPENDYEIIFVDDRSKDDSFAILQELARRNSGPPVGVIRLSRNSGSHVALLAGAYYCRGEVAVVISADMQCPLEAIPELVKKHQEGYPIVWGVRESRKDPILTRVFSWFYYIILKLLVKQEFRFFNIETFLIDRKVINQLVSLREKNTNVILLISSLGFDQGSINVHRLERVWGRSSWTLGRKIKLMIDSLVSFSYLPIRFISYLGIFISLCGFLLAAVEIYQKLTGTPKPLGWTFLIVIILVIFGLQLLMLGIVGEYLWRAFDQISAKPMFVVDCLEGLEKSPEENHPLKKEESPRKEFP